MFCFMDSFLRRLQNLPAVLNRKQNKRWHRKQSKQINTSTQIYGRTFQSSVGTGSYSTRMENQFIRRNDEQRLGIVQVPRYFNSTDSKSNCRDWEPTTTNFATKNKQGLPIRIVSYNILAQSLLVEHLHLYRLCNQLHLKWGYRLAMLSKEILALRPDIVCMQEVQENHLGDIIEKISQELPMNYLFKKKTGFRTDGCAIFYNKNLFEIISSEAVEYFQPGIDLLDRHNIALIAKLRCISKPSVAFLVCTTHLLYNPKREDVRLAQLMILLAELDRHSVVGCPDERIPIILTGDFNFQPDSAPFKFITSGNLCYEELSRRTLKELDGTGTPQTGKSFISPQLGITDNCQHIDCVRSNYKDTPCRVGSFQISTETLSKYSSQKQLHTTSKNFVNCEKPAIESNSKLFSTGTLTHDLKLKSMYNNFDAESYGSTFQHEWITVDHMFYSETTPTDSQQGSLNLLSLYQLPTVQQCSQIGPIPNADLGSDHLMLASNLFLNFPDET